MVLNFIQLPNSLQLRMRHIFEDQTKAQKQNDFMNNFIM